ncbi:MAG: hypothetical protein HYX60_03335 [Legionella longbeachae]|nr:hypothetical protein [Legionella longbeachae]
MKNYITHCTAEKYILHYVYCLGLLLPLIKLKVYYLGHYGLFNGKKFRNNIIPEIHSFTKKYTAS